MYVYLFKWLIILVYLTENIKISFIAEVDDYCQKYEEKIKKCGGIDF
jgi:hypothetical protein